MNRDLNFRFYDWFQRTFRMSAPYERMLLTVEDSPYHREANVGVHTAMVVEEYRRRTNNDWDRKDLLGAVAAAFHDVGKPLCEETVVRDDGEIRRRYAGHEIRSARMFINHALDGDLLNDFDLTRDEIYDVAWMIEHHLPWNVGKDKTRNMRTTAYRRDLTDTFVNLVRADQTGRIKDRDHDDPRKVEEWVEYFLQPELAQLNESAYQKTLFVLIGPSGSGKSTWVRQNAENTRVFSLDALRHEFYNEDDYSEAFHKASNDPQFKSRANQRFIQELRDAHENNGHVVVDNTSVSRKARAFYLAEAKRRHFRTVGVVFLNSLDTLVQRQRTRPDKTVPKHAVEHQFYSVQLPQYGEFDDISIL